MWTRTRVPGSTSIAIAMRRRRTTTRLHQGDLQHQAPALGASYVPPNEFEKSFAEHAAWIQRPQRSKPRGFTPVTCLKVLVKHRSRSFRSLHARMRRVGANICGQSLLAGLQLRSKGVRGVVGPSGMVMLSRFLRGLSYHVPGVVGLPSKVVTCTEKGPCSRLASASR